ncbi:DUF1428 family protein [Virgibacillus sp. JSM 102003]|uniref:DUF1428 family protein n=1 Tax=Virgibacillus sp. JSM 102003 TaxID=1562108 RepID=UPI0035BF98B4
MFTVIYLYRVNKEHAQTFTDINEKASEIYLAKGALEDKTYHADDLNGKYGCAGLLDIVDVKENEVVYFGQSVFRNKNHHDDVLNQVNDDPDINDLFDKMTRIIDLSKVVTATFSTEY